jgi:hypothetical protein
MEGMPPLASLRPDVPQPQGGKGQKIKLAIIVGGAVVLLLCALYVLLNKGQQPVESDSVKPTAEFSQTFARPQTPAAPLEPPPSSRDVQSHLFAPISDKPASETVKTAEEQPKEMKLEPERVAPEPPAPGRNPRAEQQAGAPQQKRKMDLRSTGSGGGMGGGLVGVGGGMNLGGGGGGYAMPAAGGSQNEIGGSAKGKDKFSGARDQLPSSFAQPGDTRHQQQGALQRLQKRTTSSGRPEFLPGRRIETFKKDPKGEHTTDETSPVKPGYVQMDNGQYIHVIEMGGISGGADAGKGAGGATIGGANGAGALNADQGAVLNQLKGNQ